MTKWTLLGEIPFSCSRVLISRVPMLLVPLTPIFLPARSAMVVIPDLVETTSVRVSGRRVEASARIRKLAPAA